MGNKVLVVGAGLSGSTIARILAEAGQPVHVVEARPHVAGLCHTSRDKETGILVHRYGPHIFHTSKESIWAFVQRFATFAPWVNRVKAINRHGIFSMPVNLHTINQFFGKRLSPAEARAFIESRQDKSIGKPRNAEEQLLRFVGREIYEAFFYGYTVKQWGVEPAELPADIIKRLPIRFNYDDDYYNADYQGFPVQGYTAMVERMLQHGRITVETSCPFEPDMEKSYAHVFYTGTIDGYFRFCAGALGYRTVTFETVRGKGDLQGNGCINYTERDVPWTRAHEHKYFSPWEQHEASILLKEYSHEATADSDPFYPKRLAADCGKWREYQRLAASHPSITFAGRLGSYRYLDMDVAIAEAAEIAQRWLKGKGSSCCR